MKLCTQCRYCIHHEAALKVEDSLLCTHPGSQHESPMGVVNGVGRTCAEERRHANTCGREARWFEAKPLRAAGLLERMAAMVGR